MLNKCLPDINDSLVHGVLYHMNTLLFIIVLVFQFYEYILLRHSVIGCFAKNIRIATLNLQRKTIPMCVLQVLRAIRFTGST